MTVRSVYYVYGPPPFKRCPCFGPTRRLDQQPVKVSTALMGLVPGALLAISATTLLGVGPGGQGSGRTITLYGFSALEEPMRAEVIPAFQKWYRRTHGEEIRVVSSFAGSGTIFNQIRFGAPGQVAVFATEVEPRILAEEGLISTDWAAFPNQGTFAYTTAVIVAHAGNYTNIRSFQDLAKPDVRTIVPDPTTSGGAQWAILAIFGSVYLQDGPGATSQSGQQAATLVTHIRDNAVSLPDSARQALIQFDLGYGDLLLTYENEALLDVQAGRDYEIVVPPSTVIIEPKAVIIDANVSDEDRPAVEAFLDFLWTREAQEILAGHHFRVVDDVVARRHEESFQPIERPFSVQDLGGWEWATDNIIDGVWRDGSPPLSERGDPGSGYFQVVEN